MGHLILGAGLRQPASPQCVQEASVRQVVDTLGMPNLLFPLSQESHDGADK